jgi:multimeric flavodoxin WrbA
MNEVTQSSKGMGIIMAENPQAVAISGSYRKGGTVDSVVSEILEGLRAQAVDCQTVYLRDCHIEFCTNCRNCLQVPGTARGNCLFRDDMNRILDLVEAADYLILGAPTNAGNANALTRKFIERCVCFTYWPWGSRAPVARNQAKTKKSILVSASGAPLLIGKYFNGTLKALNQISELLGARPVGDVWVGGVINKEIQIPARVKAKCARLAHKMAGA